MFDTCARCNAMHESGNEAAELYVNEDGAPVVVMWGSPENCEVCDRQLQPHVCPDLHGFETPGVEPTLIIVRMCKILDVTEQHKLRVPPCRVQEVANEVAAKTHAVTTVFIGAARATARPHRR